MMYQKKKKRKTCYVCCMSIEDQVDQTTILWSFQQSKTVYEVSIYILLSQKIYLNYPSTFALF